MAAIVLLNLGFVAFDRSYVPWRDFYLRYLPSLTQWYGYHIKGIEPHRTTEAYLQAVTALENQVAVSGLQSPQTAQLLQNLQARSAEMIDENPFETANKSGTLERIKNRMRDRMNVESSKAAFNQFWSEDYLSRQGWTDSINFFDRRIRPLIAANYYRSIGENGEPIDRFWLIDIWFIGLFAAELLARIIYLTRQYQSITWLDALLWRWYDLLLLLPFWRFLRIIPATVRLHRAGWVNLKPITSRIVRDSISSIAVEITEMVVMQIINQVQESIERGEVTRLLLHPPRYVDLNNVDEVEVISQHLITLLVRDVLPKLQPDLEALLQHSISQILNSAPIYRELQRLPGMSSWAEHLSQQLTTEVTQNAYHALTQALNDQVGAALVQRLIRNFGTALQTEAQKSEAIDEIQTLTSDLLEELKVNYVERISQDRDRLRSEQQLYQVTKKKQHNPYRGIP
jgi:hypothetical protein